ncbi:MAG TPA: sodium:solute symporter family protein [Gemmatimonadaceae bacterium]|nr:sodium:solute symporter family protein [Gemmatimonadaceae bacterium]
MTPSLAAILVYLVLQFAIGVWISRRIKNEADYLVAGRSLGLALATFSIFATWFGAETMVGSSGSAYREGLTPASAEPFGYGLCLILGGLIYAMPIWRRQLTTMADLYRQRYSVLVERVAAIILIPSSILWSAAQVRAFGHVLATSATTLEVNSAIGIAAGLTIGYTMFGGLLADAVTDLIQGVLLAVGLIIVFVAVVAQLGGVEPAVAAVAESGRIGVARGTSVPLLDAVEAWAIPVFGSLVTAEIVGRIIATRTAEVARRASLLAGTMYIAIGLIPVFVGIVGYRLVSGIDDPEQLMAVVARTALPTVGYAIFAGALTSAILSTVNSTLLIASGLLSHNLLIPTLGVTRERTKVLVARAGVGVFGIIAYVLALRSEGVFTLVEQASAFGSAGALVTFTFGLFTRLGGPVTALATLIVGTVTYLLGSYGNFPQPFLLSLVVSLLTYLTAATLERLVKLRQDRRVRAA